MLANPEAGVDEKARALSLAEQWRACHAYPINTFQSTLRDKLNSFSDDYLVAQRLKRMPTIIDKLTREHSMQLSSMQDIGGVRAVLGDVEDVYKLADLYKNKSRFDHKLINEKDYIMNPRNEDGYRSLHLIYEYQNRKFPNYDGLKLELQIRTKLQHTWATAVETMDTFLGERLKYRKGDPKWQEFFTLISSAFAYQENKPPIPRFNHMSVEETYKEISAFETSLGALDKMAGLSFAADHIVKTKGSSKSYYYHIIILNLDTKRISYQSYDRDSSEIALADLSKFEKEEVDGKNTETVLVSAGPLESLRRAYPNFFLDITEFVKIIQGIVSSVR
jgi:hypothetical protein